MATYTDEQRAEFLELASEIGITRTMRQLGYPASWVTGKSWAEAAGIELPLDELKAQSAAINDWYKTEDLLLVGQEGIKRVVEALQSGDLTPDEQKKLSEAYQKYANTWLLLQGKANSISETHHKDNADIALMELLNEEAARNSVLDKEAKSYQDLDSVHA